MYLVAIGWIYVVSLMSFTAETIIGGVMNFLALGVAPLMLLLWMMGTRHRRVKRLRAERNVSAKADKP